MESLDRTSEVQKMWSYRVCSLPLKDSFGRCCYYRRYYSDEDLCWDSAKKTEARVLLVGRGASWHLLLCCRSPEALPLAKWFWWGSSTHGEMVDGVGRMREYLLPPFAALLIGRPRLSEWRQRDCSDLRGPHPLHIVSSHEMATAVETY